MEVSQVRGQRTRHESTRNDDERLDAGTSLDDDLGMTRHHTKRNRLHCLGLSVILLGGTITLSSGCDQQDQAVDLTNETKALQNTSNKVGNSINAIVMDLPRFEEGKPKMFQAALDVFWMNVTSTRLGLGRFMRDIDATPGLMSIGSNLWVGRVQDSLTKATNAGAFSADGRVALILGAAFGKERVVDELQKILDLKNQIEAKLAIQSGTTDTDN